MPLKLLLSLASLISFTLPFHVVIAAAVTGNSSTNCNLDCQQSYQQALASESKDWVDANVATGPFYANPANVSRYAAGDIVKWQDLSPPNQIAMNWTVPAGMSLSRFLYMSEDIDGSPIPATIFALIPNLNPVGANKPFRAVAWPHGTAEGTRQCAPTNHRALYYESEGPFALARQGERYPPYFMYESGALHAGDVGLGITAARQALGDIITHEWVVVGHSEGGMTVWRTNEREARSDKATGESFRRANRGSVGDVVSISLLQSLSRVFTSIRVEDYVSDIVASRIPLADQGCHTTGAALYENLTQSQLYNNISWLDKEIVVDWQKRYNGVGPYELAAPMLVVQGLNDTVTYADFTEDDFDQTCRAFPNSTTTQLLLYPEFDHDPAFQAAQADYLPWIKDRFNNVNWTKSCTKRTVQSAMERFSVIQHVWEAEIQSDP